MDNRRRQLHSCDPCRKGKRGCDAPKDRKQSAFSSCSNCKRWKKECTFNWLSLKRGDPKTSRRRAKPTPTSAAIVDSTEDAIDEILRSSQWNAANTEGLWGSPDTSEYASSSSSSNLGNLFGNNDKSQWFPWMMNLSNEDQLSPSQLESSETSVESDQAEPLDLVPFVEDAYQPLQQYNEASNSIAIPTTSVWRHRQEYASDRRSNPETQWSFCIASENTANQSARAAMSRNLIRIYHDSMENALSCWLTEHNCPYSDKTTTFHPDSKMKEWGPSWSNRMCIRVCRLDRVASSIRGRALSAEENKEAARALHLAIMSFASQWTQHAQRGIGASVPPEIDCDERSIREKVWNDARHALERSSSIPSFRIAFANIIFSLTQCPLDKSQEASLSQLLENDRAPIFLETANRQLFTFRHKFTRLQREAAPDVKELLMGHRETSTHLPFHSHLDPILTNQEHRTTLGLMFWLGVMFDTLSAAMYQRPLVVSDEDSQIASASPSTIDLEDDNDDWNEPSPSNRKQDVWGDLFLRSPTQNPNQAQPRWPCSYEEAASILSKATPVKVLLYRRITQLQTLVYRGASPKHLENVIQKTLLVYQHWDTTYRPFMIDCVTNHQHLPSRIQSWYVILDAHWHLAAMLLADVLESIDKSRLSSETARQARQNTQLITTLRNSNALAVAGLARASIQGQDSFMERHFHDSLREVAFLVEPWTAVLVHSFAKAGHVLLDTLDVAPGRNVYAERIRQNCEFSIGALRYLGRKSDMAFLAARNLSRDLDCKVVSSGDLWGNHIEIL